jgi:hypothetical protein
LPLRRFSRGWRAAWRAIRAFLQAARDLGAELGRALGPLGLPALVLALVAVTRAFPLKVAVPVCLVAVYLAYKLVKPGWADVPVRPKAVTRTLHGWSQAALDRAPGSVTVTHDQAYTAVGVLVFIVLTILCSFGAALVSPAFWSSVWTAGRGRGATALAEGALVLTGLALVLRLAKFSHTVLRAVLAVAIVLVALRAVIYAGFLPGHRNLSWVPLRDLALAAGLWFLLCTVAAALTRLEVPRSGLLYRVDPPALPERWTKFTGGLGLYVSLISSGALVIAVLWGVYFISHRGIEDASRARPAPSIPGLPNANELRPENLTDEELARTYMPVFVYSKDQRWLPIAVGSYLEEASIVTPGHALRHSPPDARALPESCRPNIAPPCFGLTIECPQASEDCAQASPLEPDSTVHRERTVYVRVLRANVEAPRTQEDIDEAQLVFEHTGPFEEDGNLRIIVQYWLFYRYDEWSAPTILGRLVQRHEGDWEAITIGFSPEEPLFVAYSAHCAGSWARWGNIHVAADVTPPTHPLVAVAEGSQANYDNSQDRRPPDWASCLGVDGTAFAAISYIWGIEDATGDDYRLLPTDIRMVGTPDAPMSFPGTWGENARTVVKNFRTFRLGPEGAGPRTPSLQALWIDPLTTIFCSFRPRMCGKNVRPPAERALVAPLDEP